MIEPLPARPFGETDLTSWRPLHQELDSRHDTRRQAFWFRRDPVASIAAVEMALLKLSRLPY